MESWTSCDCNLRHFNVFFFFVLCGKNLYGRVKLWYMCKSILLLPARTRSKEGAKKTLKPKGKL